MAPNTNAKASGESKTARKKKVKADSNAAALNQVAMLSESEPRSSTPTAENSNGAYSLDGGDELPAVKEIHKNIRNTNKKLSAMSKLDSIIAENPDLSLDDLVTTRKINADQKAQALKKPALQAQLAHYEEQLSMLKGVEEYYKGRLEAQKAAHEAELAETLTNHQAEAASERERPQAVPTQDQQVSDALNSFKPRFLTLTRFLRAAAARRLRDSDVQDEPALAFEGVLLALYGGDSNAVFAAEKLINGSDELVVSPDGTLLRLTYTQIRDLALQETPFLGASLYEPSHPDYELYQQAEREDSIKFGEANMIDQAVQIIGGGPQTDPTLAHAGLTEMDAVELPHRSSPPGAVTEDVGLPASGDMAESAANAAGANGWDTKAPGMEDPMEGSYEMIPRPGSEVETPAQTAAFNSTTSWADDTAEQLPVPSANGGFQEVQHRNQRGRGGHQWQNAQQASPHMRSRGSGNHHQGHNSRGSSGFNGRGRGDARGRGGARGGRGRGGPAAGGVSASR